MQKYVLTILIVGFYASQMEASLRQTSFNEGWQFVINNGSENADTTFVNLPHQWNDDAYEMRDYLRTEAVYEKHFFVNEEKKDKRHYLFFEGVNSECNVLLNDKKLSTHKGGYTGFYVDLNEALKFDSENRLRVEVDNRNENIAPLSGDFTIFGGIYRPVWWIEKNEISFHHGEFGDSGMSILVDKVNDRMAKVSLSLSLNNASDKSGDFTIECEIADESSKVVSKNKKVVSLEEGATTIVIELPEIADPSLWSPDKPYLYSVTAQLKDKEGVLLDYTKDKLGLRWIDLGKDNELLLNGKPLKLIGASRHQDRSGYGIALNDQQHYDDVYELKSMGANFLRLAHYPQADAVLDACDELGLVVWEEIPVVDLVNDNEEFFTNAHHQLEEMIAQHRNHPSIIFWGYMNEAVIQVPHRIKDTELRKECYVTTVELAKQLDAKTKQLDSSRLTVMAYHGSEIYNDIGLAGIADVSGWNLYDGWYGGGLDGFESFVSKQHKRYPERPLIVSEFGAGSDKRLHSFNPRKFDFSIEYQQMFMEHYWPVIRDSAYLMGGAMWNFIDFSSALRQESMPHINNKGLLYANREKKDVFFYHKAFMNKANTVVHIAVEDWARRKLVDIHKTQPIKVYSNYPKVELIIDGKSFGKKEVKNNVAVWDVKLPSGRCDIEAIGIDGKDIQTDVATLDIIYVDRDISSNDKIDISINAGSDCYFHPESSSRVYFPDLAYEKGSWGFVAGEAMQRGDRPGTTNAIKNTEEDPLFQTQRVGDIVVYRFDVPPGEYDIELGFADLNFFGPKLAYDLGTQTKIKEQGGSFTLLVNEQIVEANLSPAQLVGGNSAMTRIYSINNLNDFIEIKLSANLGESFINTISIKGK